MSSEKYPEPIGDYIRRTCGTKGKFAIINGFHDNTVTNMVKRGCVVIDGVRYMPVGAELKSGK
ncbi:MAG: hypothetical protein ACRDCI_08940 [Plesiomonas shigelloides]